MFVSLLAGIIAGTVFGGWKAVGLARDGARPKARKWLRVAQWVAASVTVLALFGLKGWPFKSETISVPEEITRTVIETVEVPVEVTRWLFFKGTAYETQEAPRLVSETVYRDVKIRSFSFVLLISMGMAGLAVFCAEAWVIHLIFRWFG